MAYNVYCIICFFDWHTCIQTTVLNQHHHPTQNPSTKKNLKLTSLSMWSTWKFLKYVQYYKLSCIKLNYLLFVKKYSTLLNLFCFVSKWDKLKTSLFLDIFGPITVQAVKTNWIVPCISILFCIHINFLMSSFSSHFSMIWKKI